MNFNQYFQKIGLNETETARANELLAIFEWASGKKIEVVFCSQSKEKIGEQFRISPANLWAFSGNQILEAKDFIARINFDSVVLDNNLTRWEMETSGAEWMRVKISFGSQMTGEFHAFAENVPFLKELFTARLRQHLSE